MFPSAPTATRNPRKGWAVPGELPLLFWRPPHGEALDVGILVRLARFDEVQLNTLRVGPCIERAADELGPIVRDKHRRLPARVDETLEDLDHSPTANRGVDFDGQTG